MLHAQKYFKCLPFLSMIYFILGISPYVFGRNLIVVYGAALSLTSLIFFPLWFAFNDIIAEVYGYKIARNIFWSAAIGQFVLGLIAFYVNKIPYIPQQMHVGYIAIFEGLPTQTLFALVIILSAWKINTSLLLRWKILMRGKYFWLRSIGSSVTGIILSQFFFFIYYFCINDSRFNFVDTIVNTIYRTSLVALVSIPAQLIVNLIKSIELIEDKKTDIPDTPLFTINK